MRILILAALFTLPIATSVQAAGCAGSGSDRFLTISEWHISHGFVPTIDMTYATAPDEKPATKIAAHLYFQTIDGEVIAQTSLELNDPEAIDPHGTAMLTPSDELRPLTQVDPSTIAVLACTNYVEFADGSGVIID